MPEVTMSKIIEKPQKIPPDGDWGWYIVVAQALSNVSLRFFFFFTFLKGSYWFREHFFYLHPFFDGFHYTTL